MKSKSFSINIPLGTIGAVFIILKVTGAVDWNWFIVLLPLIFAVGLMLMGMVIVALTVKLMNHPKIKVTYKKDER